MHGRSQKNILGSTFQFVKAPVNCCDLNWKNRRKVWQGHYVIVSIVDDSNRTLNIGSVGYGCIIRITVSQEFLAIQYSGIFRPVNWINNVVIGLGTHLFVKVPRPGDSEVTFKWLDW